MTNQPPSHDQTGLHILDPGDRLGAKSRYITLLHEQALLQHLPAGDGSGLAVDVGCGYGRLTAILARRNWRALGIDPDNALLDYARRANPQVEFRQAALPNLPFERGSVGLLLLHNILRVLHLRQSLDVVHGVGSCVTNQGWIVVVDNIRDGHPAYIPEEQLIEMFRKEGCELVERFSLRAARWWVTYLIRFGLVPGMWLPRIAAYELRKRQDSRRRPRHQYFNVMFIFRKTQ